MPQALMSNTDKLALMIEEINNGDPDWANGKIWHFAQAGEMVEKMINLDPMYRNKSTADRIVRAVLDNVRNADQGYSPEFMTAKITKEIQTLLDGIRTQALNEAHNALNSLR